MAYKNYFSRFTDDYAPDLFSGFTSPKNWRPKERAELIEPYLHWIDEKRLHGEVDKFMTDSNKIDRMYSSSFSGMKKVNRDQLIKDTMEFYQKDLPKEVVSDMFNLYMKESSKLTHKERTDKTKFRYKVLDNTVDPVNRLVSEKSNVKSMIMTRNMVQYFSMMMAYQKQINPDEFEQMKKDMGGGKGDSESQNDQDGQPNDQDQDQGDDSNSDSSPNKSPGKSKSKGKKQTPEEMLNKLLNDQRVENLLNQANENAKQEIESINEVLDDAEQEAIWKSDNPKLALDKESIQALVSSISSLKMNMTKVREIIKKLLNKSKNYFNGKPEITFENIFEASSIDGIEDYHLLHPKLRKLFTEDIMVRDSFTKGKINLYIDISGSMSSSLKYDDQIVRGIDFAKSFAMQMYQMGLIENLYTFNTYIEQVAVNQISIAGISCGGGTSINRVAKHIEQQGVNAIVVTDAADHCNVYASNAYFIGILDASFSSFDSEVLKLYSDKAQIVEFDGSTIWTINSRGIRDK